MIPSNSSTTLVAKQSSADEEEQQDLVERMLRANGCWESHLGLSDCMSEAQDWRKCRNEVKQLQECMEKARLKQYDGTKTNQ
jgi:hypothetical protein